MDIAKFVAGTLPTDWRFYIGLLVASIIGLVLLAIRMTDASAGGYFKMFSILLAFTILTIVMRFPERISEVGGTDIEPILIIMVGSFYGPIIGAIYGGLSTAISQMMTANTPQYRVAETINHIAMGAFASMFVLTAANFMTPFLIYLAVFSITGGAFCILMGAPASVQYLYRPVNVIWCYVIIRQFGAFIIGLFL